MDGLTATFFVLGFGCLIFGAELLVRRASRLAAAIGVSPLVIGVTVVAYGTSAPEAAVSIRAVFADPPQPGISIGNVVGSNVANILLVLGVAAAMAPVVVSRNVLRRAVPQVIGVSVVVCLMALDGVIGRLDGLALACGSVVYTVGAIVRGRRAGMTPEEEIDANARQPLAVPAFVLFIVDVALIICGLGLMVMGAGWLVDGATAIARNLGVSELVIGLSIIAIGTSLPEVATSVVATVRGKQDIAVGNVVGSNMFNLLLVLGVSAAVSPLGIPVSTKAQQFDLPIMTGIALLCWPIFYTGSIISRIEGIAFLSLYCTYLMFRYLQDAASAWTEVLGQILVFGVLPLTTALLTYQVYCEWRQRRDTSDA